MKKNHWLLFTISLLICSKNIFASYSADSAYARQRHASSLGSNRSFGGSAQLFDQTKSNSSTQLSDGTISPTVPRTLEQQSSFLNTVPGKNQSFNQFPSTTKSTEQTITQQATNSPCYAFQQPTSQTPKEQETTIFKYKLSKYYRDECYKRIVLFNIIDQIRPIEAELFFHIPTYGYHFDNLDIFISNYITTNFDEEDFHWFLWSYPIDFIAARILNTHDFLLYQEQAKFIETTPHIQGQKSESLIALFTQTEKNQKLYTFFQKNIKIHELFLTYLEQLNTIIQFEKEFKDQGNLHPLSNNTHLCQLLTNSIEYYKELKIILYKRIVPNHISSPK